MLDALKKELRKYSSQERAKSNLWFFKTGKGQYGEGDVFLGLTVPDTRKVAVKFTDLKLKDAEELLKSRYHEERLCALLLLVHNFNHGNEKTKKEIFDFYLRNTKRVNNWDLVDLSAHKIVGEYLFDKDRKILYELAKSSNLWEKRISIISTFYFISKNEFQDSLKISEMHLKDKHDLMHKAVGWMLREIGKRNLEVEENFLKKHYKKMPRTMLRYSIEKFPEEKRKKYLLGKI